MYDPNAQRIVVDANVMARQASIAPRSYRARPGRVASRSGSPRAVFEFGVALGRRCNLATSTPSNPQLNSEHKSLSSHCSPDSVAHSGMWQRPITLGNAYQAMHTKQGLRRASKPCVYALLPHRRFPPATPRCHLLRCFYTDHARELSGSGAATVSACTHAFAATCNAAGL